MVKIGKIKELNNIIFTPFTLVDGVMRICSFKIKQLYSHLTGCLKQKLQFLKQKYDLNKYNIQD